MFRLILMSFLATDAEGAAALRLGALPPSVIDFGKYPACLIWATASAWEAASMTPVVSWPRASSAT